MNGRRPQLDWERQGWTLSGPEVPYERPTPGRHPYGWEIAPRGYGWRGPEPSGPALRIGDAERDAAIRELGDHFAAGRLDREEFDERSAAALRARIRGDLETLFTDLPRATAGPAVRRGPDARWLPLFWLAPLLLVFGVVGLATAVVASAPWVIWTLLTVFLITGFLRRRHGPPRHARPRLHP